MHYYFYMIYAFLSFVLKKSEGKKEAMDFVTILVVLLLTLALLIGLSSLPKRGKKLPPGPTRWPIIGSLHLLGDKPHQSLAKLAKIHGPFMSLKLGQRTTIVVSSSEMAKEVLKNQDLAFSSRSIPNALHAHDDYKYSVAMLPVGSTWRTLRKIMTTNLFSVKRLDASQNVRREKVQELIAYCQRNSGSGQAVNIGRAAFRTTLNLLSNIVVSKDVTDPYSDSTKEFKEMMWNIMMEAGKPNLVDFYPILAKIDPFGIRRRMTIHMGKLLKFIGELIDERERSGISRGDLLDVLLSINHENPEELTKKLMEHLCMDLFVAGSDTTSSTLEWAMTEMLKNPHKMKKAQEEMAQVIGRGNVIDDADVGRLPYLRCVVKETLRLHPPAPLLIPRRVVNDVEVCGYHVPKGSQVFVNVWAMGRDESIWNDTYVFKPERFLESEIDIYGQNFELIPFGAGRRMCPGLPLAARMTHVMLGSLLNCFNWKLEGENTPNNLDVEEIFGLSLQKAHSLIVVPIPL